MTSTSHPSLFAWWKEADSGARKSLLAGGAGWMLDAMDVMLYAFALEAIGTEFQLNGAQKGAVASVTLLASAFGGIIFGVLADRIGRVKALVFSILIYSIFTALTATSTSLTMLILWRSLVGIGMGGEWSAGSVLVSESWPARHRGKAIGLMQSGWAIGYILAAALAALIIPLWGWRPLFVIGVAPAFFVLWIRKSVPEPAAWSSAMHTRTSFRDSLSILLTPLFLSRALIATTIATALLFAYWGLFTWIPTYLSAPTEKGGAGLGLVKSSGWIIPMQLGAFAGYISFGFFADRFGRKPTFIFFALAAAVLVPIYGLSARSPAALLPLGPLIGFFGHGYFSIFGAMLSELFPSTIRATAQGLCYNLGRGISAGAPWLIGSLADAKGIGPAIALLGTLFFLSAALILLLPETRAKELQ